MAAIEGYKFVIYMVVNDQPQIVCYANDVQINRSYDSVEISGPQGKDRYYEYDMRGYTISIPSLVSWVDKFNYRDFKAMGDNNVILPWRASSYINGTGYVLSGNVLITELNLTSQQRDMVKMDVTLLGSGPLVEELIPIDVVVYLSDFDKNLLVGCPNPYPLTIFWYDGTMIGPADNADDVIYIFNQYSASNGNYYTLTSSVDGGCQFNMQISFEAPEPYPTTIFAQQGALFAISDDQENNSVISPDQDDDQGLTPIG